MPVIKVTRKSYIRKDGIVVKGTTYSLEIARKRLKALKNEKLDKTKIELTWNKEESDDLRRNNWLQAHNCDELETAKSFQAFANLATDAEIAKVAQADAEYFLCRASISMRYNLQKEKITK